MKQLMYGENNSMNYIVLVDTEREEGKDSILVDWDLSEEELKDLLEEYEKGNYDLSENRINGYDWTSEDEAFGDAILNRMPLDSYIRWYLPKFM